MHLIVLELRYSQTSFVSNVLYLPEVYPDPGKSRFSRVIEPIFERYFTSIFTPHRRAVPNLGSQPRFFPYPTPIENP